MPGYRVVTTRAAERDIAETIEYIARDKRQAAARWADGILNGIEQLERFPERAAVIPESMFSREEYRHLVRGNYRIIFRIEGRKVLILRVIHAARLLELGD